MHLDIIIIIFIFISDAWLFIYLINFQVLRSRSVLRLSCDNCDMMFLIQVFDEIGIFNKSFIAFTWVESAVIRFLLTMNFAIMFYVREFFIETNFAFCTSIFILIVYDIHVSFHMWFAGETLNACIDITDERFWIGRVFYLNVFIQMLLSFEVLFA